MIMLEASLEIPSFCKLSLRQPMALILKFCFGQGDKFFPLDFLRDLSLQVIKVGCCMGILIASEYHICDGQTGVTRIIIGTSSFRILLKTIGIMQNWGKMHKHCGTNFMGRHLLLGSMDPASTKSKF